jgi:osmotically-inducible protein OsmY
MTGHTTPNEEHSPYLVEHVRVALASSPTAELGVDVAVTGGGVYLTGTVASDEHRLEVERVAAEAAEGLVVHNDLVVLHAGPDNDVEVLS